jgi:hypothetical protein
MVITIIGASAQMMGTKVLLRLCVLALALYRLSRVGTPAVQQMLDVLVERINRAFDLGNHRGPC